MDSDRDTVAVLTSKPTRNAAGEIINDEYGTPIKEPFLSIVRSPSRTVVGKSEHRVVPQTDNTRVPTQLDRGELDPYFAGAMNPSEDLIIGFDQSNSQLAILRNFDAAAVPTASNPNRDIPVHQFIRFNCASNEPARNPDSTVQYQPCNDNPEKPDRHSSVKSISTVDINGDKRLDIMVVADSTGDVNDPSGDPQTGQRVFGCLNYTEPGANELDFRCRDQGFRDRKTNSDASNARAPSFLTLDDRDPSGCEGPDCGGGGPPELPPLPQGGRFVANSDNGEYRGIGAGDNYVVEFFGNVNNSTPLIKPITTVFTDTVKAADLAFMNNDVLPDRVVLLQPAENWEEEGPSDDMNSAARVEVCLRDANGDGLECTPEPLPRVIARGVYQSEAVHYEYRSPSLAGIANIADTSDATPEIVIASTGAGLGERDTQASGDDLTKDLLLMALGRAGTSSHNLPLASLCVWPGNPQAANQSVCTADPTGPAPTVVFAALGNFTSRINRSPAVTYPVDSVVLLSKVGVNSNGDYEVSHEIKFISSTN